MIIVDAVRSRVRNSFETIVADLVDLVAIPSVSASSHDQSQVARSAEHVAGLVLISSSVISGCFRTSSRNCCCSPTVNAGTLWPRGNGVIRPSFLKVRIQLPT